MLCSRLGSPERSTARPRSVWAGLALIALLAGTGCQVEYAGMTLPSGKFMHDDVQYFPKGPEFPYANTQAATQRARMNAQGIPVPPLPGMNPVDAAAGNPAGMPGGGIPRPIAAPEAENLMPGGASAPNPAIPVPNPPAPGGEMPAPMPNQ